MKNFKLIKYYLKEDKFSVFLYLVLVILTSLPFLYTSFLWGYALEAVISSNYNEFAFYMITWSIINCTCGSILPIPRDYIYYKLENKFSKEVMKDLYVKMLNLEPYAFEKMGVGELINRLVGDPNKVIDLLASLVRMLCSIVTGIGVLVITFKTSWILGTQLAVFGIFMFVMLKSYVPSLKVLQESLKKESDEYTKKTTETLSGIREIKALNLKENVKTAVFNNFDTYFVNNLKISKKETAFYNINYIIYYLFQTIILLTAGYFMFEGKLTFAMFTVVEMNIWRIDSVVQRVSEFGTKYSKITVSLSRIDEILNNRLYKDEVFGNLNKEVKGNIKFNKVHFKYDEDKTETLKGLSLEFNTGKKLAIVGKSGNGKTTIFNLLLRYFDATSGTITIDDYNILDFTEESLRNNISVIRQNPFLFNLSIIDNFKMLDSNITLKKVRDVCKKAYIDEYIMSLPNKYETIIGEGGVNLSGGQKQRIAIARTLIKNSKIILFDEATSALDNESQENIKKTIDDLVKDHTIIIVAHRLSTIEDADCIYIIEDGQLNGIGTKKELLKTNKTFKSLYNKENNE